MTDLLGKISRNAIVQAADKFGFRRRAVAGLPWALPHAGTPQSARPASMGLARHVPPQPPHRRLST